MIDSLRFVRYKGFEDFSVHFGRKNVLIGPNNSGKSTIISALRLSTALLSLASRRTPNAKFRDDDRDVVGYPISAISMRDLPGFVFENIRYEFREEPASLELKLKGGASMRAVWPVDEPAFFYIERAPGMGARTAAQVKGIAPRIGIIPVLTPVDHREELLSPDYVRSNISSRLASRHFRNQLYYLRNTEPDAYKEFLEFALENTPEILDLRIETDRSTIPNEHDIFFTEAVTRSEKELFWAGDGLQIWIQILFHAYRHKDADVLVLDEPDVYLHPDLQRRLVTVLEEAKSQTIVATHAPEILTEASRESVIWIDRTRRRARRAKDEKVLGQVNAHLGSGFNLGIARALRSKLALFVEGKDMRVLRNLARTVDAVRVWKERGVTTIPLDGFTNWSNVKPFSWMAKELLGDSVRLAVLLDRDYRGSNLAYDVTASLADLGVHCHVWKKKELESYLVVPSAIARLSGVPEGDVLTFLDEVAESLKEDVESNYIYQRKREFSGPSSQHEVSITKALLADFDREWRAPGRKLELAPAKDLLHGLNRRITEVKGVTVSSRSLSNALRKGEIDSEVSDFLHQVEGMSF
ncbi:ATP-dependent nuclease [Micromonospora maritima]|uniref:ATP-dependent nuclease n=1 Tax=Micromonospora maritima TaxID=986711 RepID=UPI00157C5F96|nr:ATP-binding protein [Micromonospora maritima]